MRGDLIEVYKWVKGFNKGDISKVLRISQQDRTRSNGFKLEKSRFRREIGAAAKEVPTMNRMARSNISGTKQKQILLSMAKIILMRTKRDWLGYVFHFSNYRKYFTVLRLCVSSL